MGLVDLFRFLSPDLAVFDVIILFQDVRRWILRKIVRDLMQAQKRNSYISVAVTFYWGTYTVEHVINAD